MIIFYIFVQAYLWSQKLSSAIDLFRSQLDCGIVNPSMVAVIFHGLYRVGQLDTALQYFYEFYYYAPHALAVPPSAAEGFSGVL